MVTAHALRGDVVDIEGVAAHDVGPSPLSSPRAVLLKFGSANRGSNYLMHLHGERRDWDVSWTGAVGKIDTAACEWVRGRGWTAAR